MGDAKSKALRNSARWESGLNMAEAMPQTQRQWAGAGRFYRSNDTASAHSEQGWQTRHDVSFLVDEETVFLFYNGSGGVLSTG
jgi:hypothetical protein